MASGKRLDCVILGLLNHEDMTGYEIKKRMNTALKFFWNASYGSIYPTLKELVEKDLATKSELKESGRDIIVYTITEQGRLHLKNWLMRPVEKDELRYETLLKLFFGEEAGKEITARHIESFEARVKSELPYLTAVCENLEQMPDQNGAHLYYLLTARFGVKVYDAYLEWCEETRNTLKRAR